MDNKGSFYKYCVVPKCKSSTARTPEKIFFNIPRDPSKRRTWLKAMNRGDVSHKSPHYCCEDHFVLESDMLNYWQWRLTKNVKRLLLKTDVVPHRFDCQSSNFIQRTTDLGNRMSAVHKILDSLSEASTSCNLEMEVNDSPTIEPSISNKSVIAELDFKLPSHSKAMNANIIMSNESLTPMEPDTCVSNNIPEKRNSKEIHLSDTDEENISQTEYVSENDSNSSSEEEIEKCDRKKFKELMFEVTKLKIEKNPKLFLGLASENFFLINELVKRSKLPVINIYVVLRKIKLNEAFSILAVDFGISLTSVNRLFEKSLPVLANMLQDLIVWPSKEDIKDWLPKPYRARYGKVCSVIDCLEIEVEKPSNPVEQNLSWSTNYNCNTMKYLFSFTPKGLVSFVSEGFGGWTSDLIMFQNSGFIRNLSSETSIIADESFKHISSDLQQIGCQMIHPPSVSTNSESTTKETVFTRKIDALRQLVKNVVKRIRAFKMLAPHSCIKYKQVYLLDKAVIVACALVNMQKVLLK